MVVVPGFRLMIGSIPLIIQSRRMRLVLMVADFGNDFAER